jgi:NADH-quinone oxidoreductase subunit C
MPDATGLELIAHELNDRRDGLAIGTEHVHGIATLVVDPRRVLDALGFLCEEPAHEYRFLASLHGCDYLPHTPRFGVHYELLNMERVERLHIKAVLEDPGYPKLPEIDSAVELFPAADFQEREIYDMFGIVFRGHPDLRRILMPEDYEGHPQRRDFPLGGEPVLFTHNEHKVPRWWESELASSEADRG